MRPSRGALVVSAILGGLVTVACARAPAATPLVVFNAAALGPPFRSLGDSLARSPARLELRQVNAPSLEAIRNLTELGRVPDILATADLALFDALVIPAHSAWYLVFGTNALVLAFGPHSPGREGLTADNWWEVLLAPGVRTGRSDPSVDPSGYRTLMALQLAEAHYRHPGLAARLLAAMPSRYIRRAEADLSALVQAGELDYIWTYRNLARAHRLEYLELPTAINLADPSLTEWYAQATAVVRGSTPTDSLRLRGAPILFGLTVPNGAPHPEAARQFITLLLSPVGAAILRQTGFEPLPVPAVVGHPPAHWAAVVAREQPGK